MRARLAIAGCKLTRKVCRKLHKGGTAFPGSVALKIDKNALRRASKGVKTILVTGTNGKTTTSLMIAEAMKKAGYNYFANGTGANLLNGITAEFACNTDSFGNNKFEYAVIECDEASLKYVAPLVDPKVIVVTNLFRDQLDRYGEVMTTLAKIKEAIVQVPNAVLCLNADCSLTSSLADEVENRCIFFGMNDTSIKHDDKELSDAPRCIKCGHEYQYHYRTYGHLGDFYCPECGYSRRLTDVSIEKIVKLGADHSEVLLKDMKALQTLTVALPAVYNLYNAMAAYSAFEAMELDTESMINSLGSMSSAFGRMEKFDLEGTKVQMVLVKNPAGCNKALDFLLNVEEPFRLVFILNDGYADGKDISWIWDTNYEKLIHQSNLKEIVVSGDRRDDMALRIKYAELATHGECSSYEEIIEYIKSSTEPVFILPNYTSMLAMRHSLSVACGIKDYWEK